MNENKTIISQNLLHSIYEAGRICGFDMGFGEGLRSASEAAQHAPKNPLAMQPQEGDTIIRKMGNGYVIVAVNGHGMAATPQVVEGDMVEVGKQLIAMEAAKTMQSGMALSQQQGSLAGAATAAGNYITTTAHTNLRGQHGLGSAGSWSTSASIGTSPLGGMP